VGFFYRHGTYGCRLAADNVRETENKRHHQGHLIAYRFFAFASVNHLYAGFNILTFREGSGW
jgi:hypothetical protein